MRSVDVDLEMKLGPGSRVQTNKVLKDGGILDFGVGCVKYETLSTT